MINKKDMESIFKNIDVKSALQKAQAQQKEDKQLEYLKVVDGVFNHKIKIITKESRND